MCFATGAAIASSAFSVAGTALKMGGEISGGQNQRAAGQYQQRVANYQAAVTDNNAKVMENNAIIAEQNADYSGKVGIENATVSSMRGAAKSAKIKAGIAANNIDPNSGSALDVRVSQTELNKLEAETVMSDAVLKAYGYRSEAVNARYKAELLKTDAEFLRSGGRYSAAVGEDAETGGYLKAGGSLLSSLSSLPFSKLGALFDSGGGYTNTPLAPGGSRQLNYS